MLASAGHSALSSLRQFFYTGRGQLPAGAALCAAAEGTKSMCRSPWAVQHSLRFTCAAKCAVCLALLLPLGTLSVAPQAASEWWVHPVAFRTGTAKLADFGAATMLTDVAQRTFIGSIHWMAPEVSHPHRDSP